LYPKISRSTTVAERQKIEASWHTEAFKMDKINPQKKVDVPPTGRRNADPITNAPGSHPIETGIGAAAVGAASGMAVGAVTGPVGAAIGAAVGAIAGGYAGKGVGEMIDPTTDDNWLRDNFESRPYVQEGDTFEKYQPAYRYGAKAESRYGTVKYETIEGELESDWLEGQDTAAMPWKHVRHAVKDAYERTAQIRRARDVPETRDDMLDH
jgi:outer membrane lipoprotein SlyB